MTFRKILNKNLIMVMIPVFLILGSCRIVLGQALMMQRYVADRVEEIDGKKVDIDLLLMAGKKNAEILLRDLKYTGFDELYEGNVLGKYYLKEENGKIYFYLLKTSTADLYEESLKSDGVIYRKFHISEQKTVIESIMQRYQDDLAVGDISNIASICLCDELAFPEKQIKLITVGCYVLTLIGAVLLLYTILALLFPTLNFEAWPLKRYGDLGQAIRKLNREMKKRYVGKKGNEIITQNFHIFVQVLAIHVYTNEEYEELLK